MGLAASFPKTRAALTEDPKSLDAPRIGRSLIADISSLPALQSTKLFILAKAGCATVLAAGLASLAKKHYSSIKEARASKEDGATTQALVETVRGLKAVCREFVTSLRIEAIKKVENHDLASALTRADAMKDPELRAEAQTTLTTCGTAIQRNAADVFDALKTSGGKLTAPEARQVKHSNHINSALLRQASAFISGLSRIETIQDLPVRKELFDAYKAARSKIYETMADKQFPADTLDEHTAMKQQAVARADRSLQQVVKEAVRAFKAASKGVTPSGAEGAAKAAALAILNDKSAALNLRLESKYASPVSAQPPDAPPVPTSGN